MGKNNKSNNTDIEKKIEKVKESTLIGVVSNCEQLYIREEPSTDSKPKTIINKGSQLLINEIEPVNGFFKVTTQAGVDGFAKCDFIDLK